MCLDTYALGYWKQLVINSAGCMPQYKNTVSSVVFLNIGLVCKALNRILDLFNNLSIIALEHE